MTQTAQEIKISLVGHTLCVQPWISRLAEVATLYRTARDPETKELYESVEELYTVERRRGHAPMGILPAGLKDRVLAWFKRNSQYKVKLHIKETLPPAPDLSKIQDLRPGQPEILAAIFDNPRAAIQSPTGDGKTYCICQACRAWAWQGVKILVVVPGISTLEPIKARIEAAVPGISVGFNDSKNGQFDPTNQICVSSPQSLKFVPPDWPQVVICDEIHELAGASIYPALVEYDANMYGFSANTRDRTDGGNLVLEALFGQVRFCKEYQESVKQGNVAQIIVEIYKVDFGEELEWSHLGERDQIGYWQNIYRNQAIAELAREFAEDEQVLIYCERTEHVLALHNLLPDFALAYKKMNSEQWARMRSLGLVSKADKDRYMDVGLEATQRAFEAGTLKKAICTGVWKKGVDFPWLYALIRADAQISAIPCTQIGGRLSRTGKGNTAILIDFLDSFGKSYIRRSWQRIKQYKSHGWEIKHQWK